MTNDALLSIKPKYASLIFEGKKDIELRRTYPKFIQEMKIFIYSTSPVCAIVGTVQVKKIRWLSKTYLWRQYGSRTGTTYDEFFQYFDKSAHGCAIELKNPIVFAEPLELSYLRNSISAFAPPQSYQYVYKDSDLDKVLRSITDSNCCQVSCC